MMLTFRHYFLIGLGVTIALMLLIAFWAHQVLGVSFWPVAFSIYTISMGIFWGALVAISLSHGSVSPYHPNETSLKILKIVAANFFAFFFLTLVVHRLGKLYGFHTGIASGLISFFLVMAILSLFKKYAPDNKFWQIQCKVALILLFLVMIIPVAQALNFRIAKIPDTVSETWRQEAETSAVRFIMEQCPEAKLKSAKENWQLFLYENPMFWYEPAKGEGGSKASQASEMSSYTTSGLPFGSASVSKNSRLALYRERTRNQKMRLYIAEEEHSPRVIQTPSGRVLDPSEYQFVVNGRFAPFLDEEWAEDTIHSHDRDSMAMSVQMKLLAGKSGWSSDTCTLHGTSCRKIKVTSEEMAWLRDHSAGTFEQINSDSPAGGSSNEFKSHEISIKGTEYSKTIPFHITLPDKVMRITLLSPMTIDYQDGKPHPLFFKGFCRRPSDSPLDEGDILMVSRACAEMWQFSIGERMQYIESSKFPYPNGAMFELLAEVTEAGDTEIVPLGVWRDRDGDKLSPIHGLLLNMKRKFADRGEVDERYLRLGVGQYKIRLFINAPPGLNGLKGEDKILLEFIRS